MAQPGYAIAVTESFDLLHFYSQPPKRTKEKTSSSSISQQRISGKRLPVWFAANFSCITNELGR